MEQKYSRDSILKIAKRYNNKKRSYLLVNPLQAKHIPVLPSDSLDMMRTLGNQLYKKYPTINLVIGFAETATAIGAVVAECCGTNCKYIHTTRECLGADEPKIEFLEEHSHAVEQQLTTTFIDKYINETDTIVLVDDELSTGKTLLNIVEVLKQQYPVLNNKKIIVASIINRLSDENTKNLTDANIICEYLLKLDDEDYENVVADIEVESPQVVSEESFAYNKLDIDSHILNPRYGVQMKDYIDCCNKIAYECASKINVTSDSSVLVLGTEECMYPAILLGNALESFTGQIKCHSTTRSPIGIKSDDYPIFCGYKIPSFYEKDRETYIYDLDKYDAVIILTDSFNQNTKAAPILCNILRNLGNENIYYIEVGCNV